MIEINAKEARKILKENNIKSSDCKVKTQLGSYTSSVDLRPKNIETYHKLINIFNGKYYIGYQMGDIA